MPGSPGYYIERKNFHLYFPAKNNISPGYKKGTPGCFPGAP